mmetsp:Transcript_47599/g.108488  ORF Transcript_47599/g.108488 Transcript_47599/m.108488 type:complete len:260 (-) Transcript_47599:302-1081(-)
MAEYRLDFGSHSGQRLQDLSNCYLKFILDNEIWKENPALAEALAVFEPPASPVRDLLEGMRQSLRKRALKAAQPGGKRPRLSRSESLDGYREIVGDILFAKEQYVCHQCNCVSKSAKGLAQALFSKYPWADVYRDRSAKPVPGTIDVRQGDGPKVINLFGQVTPGKPRGRHDSKTRREEYFAEGLRAISKLDDLSSIAFPYSVGCGLAGGDWPQYQRMLQTFATGLPDVQVVVYRLPPPLPRVLPKLKNIPCSPGSEDC